MATGDGSPSVTRRSTESHDATERGRTEEALRKAHDELEMRVQERTAKLASANEQLQREISQRTRSEEAIRRIVDGITSQVGEQFFRALVRHLAAALTVRFAFISEQLDHEGARVRLVAFWEGDDYGENFEYPTKGTPCEHVVGKELASFPSGLRELFPEDAWLREVGAESYLAIPLFDSTERPLGHLGVMHDEPMDGGLLNEQVLRIFAERAGGELERKRAEETLRESEERFRQLAENAAEVSWLIDNRDYRVLYVNAAYERIWGRTCKSLYDEPRSWLDAVHPEDLERVLAALEKQQELGEFDEEFRVVQPDGTVRHVWDRTFPLRDGSGEVYRLAGVVVDITERKRAEEALQVTREELESKVERQMLRRDPHGLTFRELTVLHLVADGESDKQIGLKLSISHYTAQKHISNILSKMGAGSRTEAVARGIREGLLD